MVLADGEEVVNGGDIVHRVGEDLDLVLPGVFEHVHVLQGDLAPGTASQNPRRVDNLLAAWFYSFTLVSQEQNL